MKESPKRYRISVPFDDAIVIKWLECQHSKSLSVRQLIKAEVEANGMHDYFASDFGELIQEPKQELSFKSNSLVNVTKDVSQINEKTILHDKSSKEKIDIQKHIALMQGILDK